MSRQLTFSDSDWGIKSKTRKRRVKAKKKKPVWATKKKQVKRKPFPRSKLPKKLPDEFSCIGLKCATKSGHDPFIQECFCNQQLKPPRKCPKHNILTDAEKSVKGSRFKKKEKKPPDFDAYFEDKGWGYTGLFSGFDEHSKKKRKPSLDRRIQNAKDEANRWQKHVDGMQLKKRSAAHRDWSKFLSAKHRKVWIAEAYQKRTIPVHKASVRSLEVAEKCLYSSREQWVTPMKKQEKEVTRCYYKSDSGGRMGTNRVNPLKTCVRCKLHETHSIGDFVRGR